jgi:hypothetical protein
MRESDIVLISARWSICVGQLTRLSFSSIFRYNHIRTLDLDLAVGCRSGQSGKYKPCVLLAVLFSRSNPLLHISIVAFAEKGCRARLEVPAAEVSDPHGHPADQAAARGRGGLATACRLRSDA